MAWTLLFILGSSLAESTNGWTYHQHNTTMNWTEAQKFCKTHYTDLVVIQSQKENDYLVSILTNRTKSPYYWIGIIRSGKNETWRWVGNNSTWVGNNSWAENEPNNNVVTEFCVEIYVNAGKNRGKWNDEKCSNYKYPVCYKAQCNDTVCNNGRCQETIENITCICDTGFIGHRCQTKSKTNETNGSITCISDMKAETCQTEKNTSGTNDSITSIPAASIKADRCQTAMECPSLSDPENRFLSCSEGNWTFNSTCGYKCQTVLVLIDFSTSTCQVNGNWTGPRPTCASYKHALMALAGCGAFSALFCICFCLMKCRKRKKLDQVRQPEEITSPSNEVNNQSVQ